MQVLTAIILNLSAYCSKFFEMSYDLKSLHNLKCPKLRVPGWLSSLGQILVLAQITISLVVRSRLSPMLGSALGGESA